MWPLHQLCGYTYPRQSRQESDCHRKAAQTTVDNFIEYFTTIVDFSERDTNGKPIFTGKNVADEITRLSKVHEELNILEGQVKKQLSEQSSIRGGAVEGYTPRFKRT